MAKAKKKLDVGLQVLTGVILFVVAIIMNFGDIIAFVTTGFRDNVDDLTYLRVLLGFSCSILFVVLLRLVYGVEKSDETLGEVKEAIKGIDYVQLDSFEVSLRVAIACALKEDDEITSVRIFARAGNRYFRAFEWMVENPIVGELDGNIKSRLGLSEIEGRKLDKIGKLNILYTMNDVLEKHGLTVYNAAWGSLKNDKQGFVCDSRNIKIQSYRLIPTNHYAIINDKFVIEGLYKCLTPRFDDPLQRTFVFLNRRNRDTDVRKDRLQHFNSNFEEIEKSRRA